MHDFYPSHLHQGHMPPTSHGHATPPHQIHNPTPSYPSNHSNLTTLNPAPSYHLGGTTMSSDEQQHHNIPRNESPSNYGNTMQLPPTPNSLVTMVGPNSGNSNSNEPSTPAETMDTIASMPPPHLTSHMHQSAYSPWTTSSRPLAPISPSDMHQSLGHTPVLSNNNNGTLANSQMHHITSGLAIHHNNSSFMQQSLPNFSHSAPKNFPVAQTYYWY